MATKTIMIRPDAVVKGKAKYEENLLDVCDIYPEDIYYVGKKLSQEEASEKVVASLQYLLETMGKKSFLPKKEYEALYEEVQRALAEGVEPSVKLEYFTILGKDYVATSADCDYVYRKNGESFSHSSDYTINDKVFSTFTCITANSFSVSRDFAWHPEYCMDIQNDEMDSDIPDDAEFHKVFEEDAEFGWNGCYADFDSRLNKFMQDVVQKDLGRTRELVTYNFEVVDKGYKIKEKYAYCVPFYVFTYDIGGYLFTILVNAYNGDRHSFVNNPLASRYLAQDTKDVLKENGLEKPKFNFLIFLACGFLGGIGLLLYPLWYLEKKKKYEKALKDVQEVNDDVSYTIEELRDLI